MKLVIAAEIFPPDIGGPATYLKQIVPRLIYDGFKVEVITYADVKRVTVDCRGAYAVTKIPRKNVLTKFVLYTLKLFKLAKSAELIFAQGPVASGLPALLVKHLRHKKAAMKIVGDVAWERARNKFGISELLDEFQSKKYRLLIAGHRWLEHFIVKRMDGLLTPSFYLKKIVSHWGAPPAKVQVVYNALTGINCQLTKEQAREQLGLNGKILLSVGRLAPWKGQEALIRLMPKLAAKFSDINLIIVGDGPLQNHLRSKIKDLGLEKSVGLVGPVAHQEIGKYFRAADLFILNSGYEGLAHVLLEALALGLPVMASRVGGNPEVIDDNVSGYLFEFDNQEEIFAKVCVLLSDEEKQRQFIQAGLAKSQQFTFNRMIRETEAWLRSVSK